jgi:hypothetical protein
VEIVVVVIRVPIGIPHSISVRGIPDEREEPEAEVDVAAAAMMAMTVVPAMPAMLPVLHQLHVGTFGGGGILERLQAARRSGRRNSDCGRAERGNSRHSQFLPMHHVKDPFLLPFSGPYNAASGYFVSSFNEISVMPEGDKMPAQVTAQAHPKGNRH